MVSVRVRQAAAAGSLLNRAAAFTMGVRTEPMEKQVLDYLIGALTLAVGYGAVRVMQHAERKKANPPATQERSPHPKSRTPEVGMQAAPASLPLPEAEFGSFKVTRTADLVLQYLDAKGKQSERRITPIEIEALHSPGWLRIDTIHARCHARRARRSFVMDRIQQVVDAETGEVLELPLGLAKWFEERLQSQVTDERQSR